MTSHIWEWLILLTKFMILDRINGRDACEVWGMFPFWISEIFQKTSDVCHLMQSNKFYSPKILRNIYLDTLYLTYCIAGWRLQTAKDQGKSGRMPCTPATLACGAVPAKRSMHVVTTWWYLRSGCKGQSTVQLSDEGQRRVAIVKCHWSGAEMSSEEKIDNQAKTQAKI